MARTGQRFSVSRAARAFQSNVASAGPAAAASYTLVGGIILLGGIGYAVDRWWKTEPWGLVIGLVLGIVVGFYEIIRVSLRPPAGNE
jgi:F0F1-type ATP synthase assembly protein I